MHEQESTTSQTADAVGRDSTVIVAPSYNNVRTLPDVIERAEALGLPIIVVNDGSSDGTARWLDDWAAGTRRVPVTVIHHERNRGKAVALLTGFAEAVRLGYTHAATLDTDGQLDPEQLPDLIAVAASHPNALVLGCRDDRKADYPARSRLGRRLSNFAIRIETGVRIPDSQCGLRVYPLKLFEILRCRARRFAFEAEVITRAVWAGADIRNVPVHCRYFPDEERISHYRPWLDSFHGVALHAFLILRRLLPFPHPQLDRAGAKRTNRHRPWHAAFWRGIAQWLSPARFWRQLRSDDFGRTSIAVGVGLGVFIANLPIYGFQTILSLYVAKRLHLHPISVVGGSQFSFPPLNIILAILGIHVGHFILHGSLPAVTNFDPRGQSIWSLTRGLLLEWTLGGAVLGLVLGIITFAICFTAFNWIAEKDEQPMLEPRLPSETG